MMNVTLNTFLVCSIVYLMLMRRRWGKSRYSKDGDKMNPFAEQEACEDHQIATLNMGQRTKNNLKTTIPNSFVFENLIEFIQVKVIGGENVDDEEEFEKNGANTAHEKLLAYQKTCISISEVFAQSC